MDGQTIYSMIMNQIRTPEPVSLAQRVRGVYRPLFMGAYNFMYDLPNHFDELFDLFVMFILIPITGILLLRMVTRLVLRMFGPAIYMATYRMRGVDVFTGEAMVVGSMIDPTGQPMKCQVAIHRPGLLFEDFVGYGVRVHDFLVVPKHVMSRAMDNGLVVLKANGLSKVVKTDLLYSTRISDVCYQLFNPVFWIDMKVSKATTITSQDRPIQVSVVGPTGTSVGFASKSSIPYCYNYSGSTVAGFSGSIYSFQGAAYGMHIGVVNGQNIGVSLSAVSAELEKAYMGEAKRSKKQGKPEFLSGDKLASNVFYSKSQKGWREANILDDEDLYDAYVSDPAGRELTYDQWKDLKGEAVEEVGPGISSLINHLQDTSVSELASLQKAIEAIMVLRDQERPRKYNFVSQGTDSFEDVLTVTPDETEARFMAVEKRLDVIEKKLFTNGTTIANKKPFPCGLCNFSSSTRIGLLAHAAVKHETKFESAIPSDFQKTVAVKESFLGKTSRSTKVSGSNSKSTLKSKDQDLPSTSQEKSQSKTPDYQERYEKLLDTLAKTISGLREGQQQ